MPVISALLAHAGDAEELARLCTVGAYTMGRRPPRAGPLQAGQGEHRYGGAGTFSLTIVGCMPFAVVCAVLLLLLCAAVEGVHSKWALCCLHACRPCQSWSGRWDWTQSGQMQNGA